MISRILIAAAAIAMLGFAAYGFWQSRPAPPPPPADDAVSETEDGWMVAVRVPELSGRAALGEVAFNAKCAVCHGENAAGQNGVAPPLIHRIYEPAHHGENAFLRAVMNGVISHHWSFGNMPPVEGLTPGDIKNIVAYIRALQKENGIF